MIAIDVNPTLFFNLFLPSSGHVQSYETNIVLCHSTYLIVPFLLFLTHSHRYIAPFADFWRFVQHFNRLVNEGGKTSWKVWQRVHREWDSRCYKKEAKIFFWHHLGLHSLILFAYKAHLIFWGSRLTT